MFDGVDTGADRRFDADGAFGMRHDFAPRAMRDFDSTRHLFVAQFLYAVVADWIHHATCSHELDPVSAILDVTTHDAVHIVHSVDSIRLLEAGFVGGKQVPIAVPSGNGDEAACGDDARSRDESFGYARTQGKLGVRRKFFACVA